MNYEELTNDNDFHKWANYEPTDTDYIKYAEKEPSLIAAAHKIVDVYHTFSNAKYSFMSANYQNYGDLCTKDELGRLYTKTTFLLHAILDYSICLDLSWQVIWAYTQPSSLYYLMNNEFKKMEKECTRENLKSQLDCLISQKDMKAKELKKIMISFDESESVKSLRTLYNTLKHRGMIHFKGLGANPKTMSGTFNDKTIKILSREEYTVNEVEEILCSYHKEFQLYFNSIIKEIIPDDFSDKSVTLDELVNVLIKINDVQNK